MGGSRGSSPRARRLSRAGLPSVCRTDWPPCVGAYKRSGVGSAMNDPDRGADGHIGGIRARRSQSWGATPQGGDLRPPISATLSGPNCSPDRFVEDSARGAVSADPLPVSVRNNRYPT